MFSGKLTARIPEGVRSAEGGRQTQNRAFGLPLRSHRISSELLSSQHWRSGSTRTVRSSWSSLAFPAVLSQWEFYGDPHPTLAHSLSLWAKSINVPGRSTLGFLRTEPYYILKNPGMPD